MKKLHLLLLSLLVVSMNALAGGQIGTGGNGCWVVEGNGFSWKSIEELAHPELIKDFTNRHKKPSMPVLPTNSVTKFNLMDRFLSFDPFQRFDRVYYSAPNFHRLMKDLSKLFQVSHLVQVDADGIYEGDIKRLHKKCFAFSPALMTTSDGALVFFRPVWNKISNLSAEIMLVHETLRLAQTFHPAFQKMTNSELQLMTSLFFSGSNQNYFLNKLVQKYEERLRDGCTDHSIKSGSAFAQGFLEVFCSEEKSIEDLNHERSSDHRNTVTKLRKAFFN